jgi:hypothetical protein
MFRGDDENSNPQMIDHAKTQRRLCDLPGRPCVVARPVEDATPRPVRKTADGTSNQRSARHNCHRKLQRKLRRNPHELEGKPVARTPNRFHGKVVVDPAGDGRDAGRIADEVISPLVGLVGSEVTVTIEIEVRIPSGAPDNVVRTVTENSRTLKFTSQGLEED